MDYKHSNLSDFTQASQQYGLFGDGNLPDIVYRERYWYTLDRYPTGYNKQTKQKKMYSVDGENTGHRLFTLRELADADGRVFRRYVSNDRQKLDDYLGNDYYFLHIDIDDLSKYPQKRLVTYSDMVKLVADFRSPEYPEVYVRPSTSTPDKPWKFHIYARCRQPYYYRVPIGGGKYRKERENSIVIPEYKMTAKFIKTFMDAFPSYFQSHQFAKVDTALYSIHQCLQTAPATDITKVTRSILPDTVLGSIPTKETKRDIYMGVPSEFRDARPYPCTSSMRFAAWGITILPVSYDPRLPSQKTYSDYRVGDGLRHRFARKLVRDLWVAIHFNLRYYPQYAEPYDADRLYRWAMREVYIGADMDGANEEDIKSSVQHTIKCMDADTRTIEQIIAEDYASTVRYNDKGKVVSDYYKIAHPNRKSHKHIYWAIGELAEAGYIKRRRLTVSGPELKRVLDNLHVTLQALRKHGIAPQKDSKPRSDRGRRRASRSVWEQYISLCHRDVDGRVIVPVDVAGLARFRKFCSRNGVRYVSSALSVDDPLDIDRVVDMPQPEPWLAPWPPEDEIEDVA